MEIFCPKCKWRPESRSRWLCTKRLGGCGTTWNTFETRGTCPTCSCKWEITQCLSCKVFSLHEHWYHDPRTVPVEGEQKKSELVDA